MLLAACGACSGAVEIDDDVDVIPAESVHEEAPPLRLALAPDATLADLTAEAAAAWNAAGAEIVIADDGVPVLSTPEAQMWTPCTVDGKPYSCLPSGKFEAGLIRIRETAACPLRTIAHEIGHALGAEGVHAAAPSLMQANPGRGCDWDSVVDEAAVALVRGAIR